LTSSSYIWMKTLCSKYLSKWACSKSADYLKALHNKNLIKHDWAKQQKALNNCRDCLIENHITFGTSVRYMYVYEIWLLILSITTTTRASTRALLKLQTRQHFHKASLSCLQKGNTKKLQRRWGEVGAPVSLQFYDLKKNC